MTHEISPAEPSRPTSEPSRARHAPASGESKAGERDRFSYRLISSTMVQIFAIQLIGRWAPYIVFALSLLVTVGTAAYIARIAREPDWHVPVILLIGLTVSCVLFGITLSGLRAWAMDVTELNRTQEALAEHAERLRILHEIDRALIAQEAPEAIAGAVLRPLRELLGVPRAIVNMFDLAAGEVEWLAAAGRRRIRLGPGVRYSIRLMGDVEALQRGESQVIDVHSLPPGPEVEALLASGVHVYMVVPMIAGGELIGALSFGGAPGPFPDEQVSIAQEAAMQLAIAIAQARLHECVKRHAEELDLRVRERTQELYTAHAELQKTNAELVQLTSELQAANRELEAFSYSVSHDLRAPLRSIDGFSQALLEDAAEHLDEQGKDYLTRIRESTQRMAQLIDALLALSRITRAELQRQDLDLSAMAQAIAADLRRQEPTRQVAFVIADGLRAIGDPRLLRVALENLLGNAWKFTAKCPQGCIEVGHLTQLDGILVFFIRDNGAGFEMAYADKLFGAFQRLHRDGEFPGTGIGLATVQRIIHRHGGRIWAESAVNQGATFYFTVGQSASET
jgi:signal transduction histidine kinase